MVSVNLNIKQRVAPNSITELMPNQVFVFGSNKEGMHGAGAALFAHKNFGAIMRQGHGLQGQSYAIDTMSGYEVMREEVKTFIDFAKLNKHLTFLVTEIGCGIAGFKHKEVAVLFYDALNVENVYLPEKLLDYIQLFCGHSKA